MYSARAYVLMLMLLQSSLACACLMLMLVLMLMSLVKTSLNCLISIFSAGGYFYLEPRTLQVLFCPCVLNDRHKLLDQNQNFEKVALDFFLAEALSILPEFGSEQTMKFETTYEHNVAA